MEYYNEVISKNPKIELIFHSWDDDPGEMRAFQSKYGIRFPAFRHGIMKTDRDSIPTVARHIPEKLPYVVMIDRKGDVINEDTNLDAVKRFLAAEESK